MVKVQTKTVTGHMEMEIPYTFLSKEEESKNLAIILPGAGYTAQAPLLHYATGVFITKAYEILQVNYQYNKKEYKDLRFDEIAEIIKSDVKTVLDEALINKTYENIYLIGKSLGTIAMSSELNRAAFQNAKAIWLTPLIQRNDVLDAMVTSKNQGLCVIGDKDPVYSEERYAKVVENAHLTAMLIPNVNHSLEYNDSAVESIDVLKRVIAAMDQF